MVGHRLLQWGTGLVVALVALGATAHFARMIWLAHGGGT